MSGPDWVASVFLFGQTGTLLFIMPALFAGLLTAWMVILSPIPALLLSATDEQSCLMTAPGQMLVRPGHGLEAIRLTGLGGLMGLFLLAILLPIATPFLATLHRTLAPHWGWILWSAVVFLVLSERPRSAPTALSRWDHITYTMAPVFAGLATLLLSGLLGIILYYRSPIPLTVSFMNFIPAIIGIFSVPGLLGHIFMPSHYHSSTRPTPNPSEEGINTREEPTPNPSEEGIKMGADPLLGGVRGGFFHAVACGAFAGIITALIPALTGATGALLTQQLTGTHNARTQLVAQGVTRTMYYGAGLLLIFLPGAPRMRSSSAALLRTFYEPAPGQVWLMAGVITFSAIAAWFILPIGTSAILRIIERHGTRPPAIMGLTGILIFVASTTSWPGLLILLTASGIGLIPSLFQARPVMGIGVVLIPMAIALLK